MANKELATMGSKSFESNSSYVMCNKKQRPHSEKCILNQ